VIEPGILAWRYTHGREPVYIEELAGHKDPDRPDAVSYWVWLLDPRLSEDLRGMAVLTWNYRLVPMTPLEQLAWTNRIPQAAK